MAEPMPPEAPVTSAAVPSSPRSIAPTSVPLRVGIKPSSTLRKVPDPLCVWNCGTIRVAMLAARLQVLLAALCFATTGTAQALGPDGIPPVDVGAVRGLVGGALLWLVARAWP